MTSLPYTRGAARNATYLFLFDNDVTGVSQLPHHNLVRVTHILQNSDAVGKVPILLSCTGCRRMSMVQNIHRDAHFCSRGSAHEAESAEHTGKATEFSLTGPLYVQNQAVIATSVHLFHRALRHRPVLKADKRKALSDTRIPIAADIDTSHTPK